MKKKTDLQKTGFVSDMHVPNMLYGMLLRSPIRKGRLLNIVSPKLPDGYFFYSATDIPGKNSIATTLTSVSNTSNSTIPIFASYEINYAGEPLGILVGSDIPTVERLLKEFKIETEKEQAFEFHKTFSEKQIISKKVFSKGKLDIFNTEIPNFSTIEQTFSTPITDSFSLENLSVLTTKDESSLKIYAPTQWLSHLRETVASVLDLDETKISVFATSISEAQDNNLLLPSVLASQAMLATFLSGHPVKLILSRKEELLYGAKTPPAIIRHKTVVNENGLIIGMNIRILINVGEGSPLIDDIMNRMLLTATGLYHTENLYIEIFAIKTSMPPFLGYRGWGTAETFFAIETHLNYISQKQNIPPVELKLLNTIDISKNFFVESQAKQKNILPDLLEQIMNASDFARKQAAFQYLAKLRKNNEDGPLKGIGLAIGYQGVGDLSLSTEGSYAVQAQMEKDGSLHFFMTETSQSMEEIWRKIACNILDIEQSAITFNLFEQDELLKNGACIDSIHITQLTKLVVQCCNTIQKQRFRNPLPIIVKKNSKNTKRNWNPEKLEGTPFSSVSLAAVIAEIEINPTLYLLKIRNIWFIADTGEIYSHVALKRAISKEIHKGLSLALLEQHDRHFGKISADFFPDYSLLDFTVYQSPDIQMFETKTAPKSIANLAISLLPAAIASATSQALNTQITSIPISQSTLFKALKKEPTQDQSENRTENKK